MDLNDIIDVIGGGGIVILLAPLAGTVLAGALGPDGLLDTEVAKRGPRIVPEGRTFAYRLRDGVRPVADLCHVLRDDDGTLVDITDDLLAFGNGGNGGIISSAPVPGFASSRSVMAANSEKLPGA